MNITLDVNNLNIQILLNSIDDKDFSKVESLVQKILIELPSQEKKDPFLLIQYVSYVKSKNRVKGYLTFQKMSPSYQKFFPEQLYLNGLLKAPYEIFYSVLYPEDKINFTSFVAPLPINFDEVLPLILDPKLKDWHFSSAEKNLPIKLQNYYDTDLQTFENNFIEKECFDTKLKANLVAIAHFLKGLCPDQKNYYNAAILKLELYEKTHFLNQAQEKFFGGKRRKPLEEKKEDVENIKKKR